MLSWTRKRNNVERLFKGEAYRFTGYGIAGNVLNGIFQMKKEREFI
jgi:hypothetical protein